MKIGEIDLYTFFKGQNPKEVRKLQLKIGNYLAHEIVKPMLESCKRPDDVKDFLDNEVFVKYATDFISNEYKFQNSGYWFDEFNRNPEVIRRDIAVYMDFKKEKSYNKWRRFIFEDNVWRSLDFTYGENEENYRIFVEKRDGAIRKNGYQHPDEMVLNQYPFLKEIN